MKETSAFNQVMTRNAFSMQGIIQVVHRLAQKSCRGAFQLLCCPLDTLLYEKMPWRPGQNHQSTEDKTTQASVRSPPSTILIVNISNSTLIDCVIGNDTHPPLAVESQPLMQESELHDRLRCGCSHGQQGAAQTLLCPPPPTPPLPSAQTPSINIHSSHLNCVIIGDNNYMNAEQTNWTDTEEAEV